MRRTVTAIGLAEVLPPVGDYYACPCCLTAYGRPALEAGVFTDEHVPPRTAGGKVLVLTCGTCNHESGSQLDAHADRRELIRDFVSGRAPRRALRAEIAVDGMILRANVGQADDALLLSVAPKANNPRDLVEAVRVLDGWTAEGSIGGRLGFRFREKVSVRQARLSWVRSAYLAAFAAFGWRYALLSQLETLRAQLADPETELLPPLAMIDDTASLDRRQVLIVREPAELRSLAVVIGRHTVFLPSPENPQPFEATATALATLSATPVPRPQLVGKEIPWPTEPRYALDR